MEAELTVAFLTFNESYVSTVTCRPYQCVEVRSSIVRFCMSLMALAGRGIISNPTFQVLDNDVEVPARFFTLTTHRS